MLAAEGRKDGKAMLAHYPRICSWIQWGHADMKNVPPAEEIAHGSRMEVVTCCPRSNGQHVRHIQVRTLTAYGDNISCVACTTKRTRTKIDPGPIPDPLEKPCAPCSAPHGRLSY